MGKKVAPLPEQVTVQSGNSLLNLRLGGDYADLSRMHSMKINKTQSWNFISAVTFGCFWGFFACAVSSGLQTAYKLISQTLLDASTGWRITSVPSSTWPSLPLLRCPHGPSSASLCLCGTVSEFLSHSVSQTVGQAASQDPHKLISGHGFSFLKIPTPLFHFKAWLITIEDDRVAKACRIARSICHQAIWR